MSQHNPDVQPPHVPHPNEAIQPHAPDFVETPEVSSALGGQERLPVWLYLVCGFALFLTGSSFTGFGNFGLGLLDQGQGTPSLAGNTGTETAAANDPMTLGKKGYGTYCASCHTASGEGQPGKYPPLGNSEWVIGSKERLAAIVLHGLSGPVTVRGDW